MRTVPSRLLSSTYSPSKLERLHMRVIYWSLIYIGQESEERRINLDEEDPVILDMVISWIYCQGEYLTYHSGQGSIRTASRSFRLTCHTIKVYPKNPSKTSLPSMRFT